MAGQKAAAALSDVNAKNFPLLLYKRILRLHYGLPLPARVMGDTYVKDEWRRHKDATPQHSLVFLREWTEYCVVLSKQLSNRGIAKGEVGKDIRPTDLDVFSDEQLVQLLELKERTQEDLQRLKSNPEGIK